jgi:hypothetical protein
VAFTLQLLERRRSSFYRPWNNPGNPARVGLLVHDPLSCPEPGAQVGAKFLPAPAGYPLTYQHFNIMGTIRIVLGLLCLGGIIGHRLPDRHLLNTAAQEKILSIARSQLDVRETGGNNHGKAVGTYLAYVNLPEGNPYCAAFISWVYGKAGYLRPKTAWSPDLFPIERRIKKPQPADVLGIYSLAKQRVVHCGIVEKLQHDWVVSIEGNTNGDGSSDGDGNYRKWRHQRTIKYYSRWLGKAEVQNE